MELNSSDYVQIEKTVERIQEICNGNQLCHYTSMSTFLSMIEKKEIWLGNTGSMNDKKEMLNFIEVLEKELSQYDKIDFFERVKTMIPYKYHYAFCLSRERDDAAQWERYGDNAKGVCIIFNVEKLCKLIYGYQNILFKEIIYDNDKIITNKHFEIVKKYLEDGEIELYSSEEELIKYLLMTASFYKHPSFQHECEIRLSTVGQSQIPAIETRTEVLGETIKDVVVINIEHCGHEKGVYLDNLIDGVILGLRSNQNINVFKHYMITKHCEHIAKNSEESDCPLR